MRSTVFQNICHSSSHMKKRDEVKMIFSINLRFAHRLPLLGLLINNRLFIKYIINLEAVTLIKFHKL